MKLKISYTTDATGMSPDSTIELNMFNEGDFLYCCHDSRNAKIGNRFLSEVTKKLIEQLDLSVHEQYGLHIWKVYAV